MTYSEAKILAEANLADLKNGGYYGFTRPYANVIEQKISYVGPKGSGYESRVILAGKARDVIVVRHEGPEAYRDRQDKTFSELKSEALSAISSAQTRKPYFGPLANKTEQELSAIQSAIESAATVEDLLA